MMTQKTTWRQNHDKKQSEKKQAIILGLFALALLIINCALFAALF